MRRESFVCESCGSHVQNTFDRYEARVEIRRADRGTSMWSRTFMRLCRTCANKPGTQERAEAGAQARLI